MIYNLDSNVIIEILRSNPVVLKNLSNIDYQEDEIAISSVVYYEIVRGFNERTAKRKITLFHQLYEVAKKLSFNQESADIAAEIYKQLCAEGKKIEDADILIAATSLANNSTLVTYNLKHFGRIKNLKIVNWLEEVKL